MTRRFAPADPVAASLSAAALLAYGGLPFLTSSPNRLSFGSAIQAAAIGPDALLPAIPMVVLLGLACIGSRRPALPLACLCLAALLFAAGDAAAALPGRIGLGGGFWAPAACMMLAASASRAAAPRFLRIASFAALAFVLAAFWRLGVLDRLSLVIEYRTHAAALASAITRHLVLSAATVAIAVATGLPLGIAAAARPGIGAGITAVLNVLQTIPSIALFGLLIAPLSALASHFPALARIGIGGVGPAPALIALVLYALLPIVRNTDSGIRGVDPAIVEAATGMGLTAREILHRVELPLAAAPVLAGIRVVAVQTIGLATVASLIGAGGLGTFVFAGIGEFSTDLVLLGAIPAVVLALLAAGLLGMLELAVARRFASPGSPA